MNSSDPRNHPGAGVVVLERFHILALDHLSADTPRYPTRGLGRRIVCDADA
jgi:hypothetical protein